jgi:hypothetical protein
MESAASQLEPIYQRPVDLELGLFAGDLPVQLTILAQKTVTLGAWAFGFHIIGESHFVSVIQADKPILHEVLACVQLPAAACQHHHRFADLLAHRYDREPYTVSVSLESGQAQPPSPKKGAQLELAFPEIFEKTPITRVGWMVVDGTVTWWTTHLYPERDGITTVRTASKFKCW